jgi:Mor family transcriptional regulator
VRSKIEQVIGADAMRKLIAEYGGQQLYIPRARRLEDADVVELRELKAGGMHVNELARRFGVSARTVYKALKGGA